MKRLKDYVALLMLLILVGREEEAHAKTQRRQEERGKKEAHAKTQRRKGERGGSRKDLLGRREVEKYEPRNCLFKEVGSESQCRWDGRIGTDSMHRSERHQVNLVFGLTSDLVDRWDLKS